MEATKAYLNQEYKKGFKDWTLPYLQHMHIKNHPVSKKITDAMNKRYLELCAITLEENGAIQFVYNGLFYDLFESSCEVGWVVNVYPNDKDKIFDEDNQLIDDEQVEGGLCTASAKDAVYFMIGEV